MKAPRATEHFFLSIIPVVFLFFVIFSFFPTNAHAWKMEAGVINLPAVSSGSTTFTTAPLQQTYASAPLIFILPGEENAFPSTIRIRNVTTTNFQVAQVEAPNGDGAQPTTTIHYLVVEPGQHTLPDGTVLEAGTLTTTAFQNKLLGGQSWGSVSFANSFPAIPAVLARVQTMVNESGAVPGAASVPWLETTIINVTTSGFNLALERAEVVNGTVGSAETIAYFAMAAGSNGTFIDNGGTTISYEAISSPDTITGDCTWINFANTYPAAPLVIGTQNRRDGGDGGWLRRCASPQTNRVQVQIEEDTAGDSERNHTSENAGLLVFSQPFDVNLVTPMADYHFDECDISGGTVLDNTGSYNGTVTGAVTTIDDASGPVCRVGDFTGGAIDLNALGVSTAAGAKTTVSFWMNWDGTNGVMPFGWNRHDLWLNGDRFGFNTFNSDQFGFTGAAALLANGWHHITAVFTNGNVSQNKIYIDGVAQAVSQVAGSPNNTNSYVGAIARIGGDRSSNGYRFSGKIDEVMIFNGELSAPEITAIYTNQLGDTSYDGSPRICSICLVPRADYRMDECAWNGTTDEVADASPNGYHGTATNATISSTAQFCRSGDFTANSTTDYISLPNGAADGLTDFSVSAWIKTANSGSQAILSGASATQYNEMLMWLNNSTQFMAFINGGSRSIAITDIADNAWHHLVWTRSGGTNCIYRDSVLQGCQGGLSAAAVSIAPGGLIIGQEQDSLGGGFAINQDFEGNIDQLRIYDGALTASEVTSLFNETQAGCSSCAPPTTEWRFDECSWDGTANEVNDEQGVAHGIRQGDATTTTGGQLCQAGTFDGAGDYVDMGDALNTVFVNTNNIFTVTSWLKPTTLGSAVTNHQTANTYFAKASDSFNDNIELGINSNGTVHVYIDTLGQDTYAEFGGVGSVVLNAWNFVAVTYNNGTVSVSINGTTYTNTTTWAGGGNIDNAANSNVTVGASIHIDNYFTGAIDEVRVYQTALAPAELAGIEAETRPSCPFFCDVPVADYHFDECSFTSNTAPASVGPDGTVTGSVSIVDDGTPPPVCRVANFAGGAIDLDGLPVSTVAGDKTTVSFWMNWDGTNSVMPFGWNYHDLWFSGDRFGFNTFAGDQFGITGAAALLANNWHHITAVFTNGNVSQNKLYIDGVAQSVSQVAGSPNNTNAYVGAIARIGGVRNTSSYRFRGKLDEVMIFNGELTTTSVATLYANQLAGNNYDGTTRSCTCVEPPPDHYVISHSGNGITCDAETVTITAHDPSDTPLNVPAGTQINITSNGTGDWYKISAGGTFANLGSGDANYTFPGGTNSVVLELAETTAITIDIDVTDGTASAPNGGAEDLPLVFADVALRFYADGTYTGTNPIDTQIAGKSSFLAPNVQTLTIKAVQTSTDTGQCVPSFASQAVGINFGYECVTLGTCSGSDRVGIIAGSDANITCTAATPDGTAIPRNNTGFTPPPSSTSVNLNFDAAGIAPFSMVYCDAGSIRLHASNTIPAAPPDPAVTSTGQSNTFIVRPFGFFVDDTLSYINSTTACGANCQVAGQDFQVDVRAFIMNNPNQDNGLLVTGSIGNNGIPDIFEDDDPTDITTYSNNNSLSGNATASNFAASAVLTRVFIQPLVGVSGTFSASSPALSGGTGNITDANWDEVGVITVKADTTAYLTTGGNITGTSSQVGRFKPDHFDITLSTQPIWKTKCGAPTGFTYLGEQIRYQTNPVATIQARNSPGIGGNTNNYTGSFWRIDSSDITGPSYSANKSITTLSAVTPTISDNGNGAGTLTFADIVTNILEIDRDASPVAPVGLEIKMNFSLTDAFDGVTVANVDGAPQANPVVFPDNVPGNGIPFDGNKEVRWGRALIGNTFGPDDAAQTLPFTLEYYDSTNAFIPNPDDTTCTSYDGPTDLSCVVVTGPVACVDVTEGGVGIQNNGSFTLTAPNNTGVLGFTLTVDSWLLFDWDGDTNHDNNPSANATFGIYRGNDRIINWREILR